MTWCPIANPGCDLLEINGGEDGPCDVMVDHGPHPERYSDPMIVAFLVLARIG